MLGDVKVAFVFSRFPSIWQTFLSREVHGLIEKGLSIVIFSLKKKKWKRVQSEALDIENRVPVIRCGYFCSLKVALGNLFFIVTRPTKYLQTLIFAMKHSRKGRRITFVKNMVMLPKTIYFAYSALRQGVNHIHAQHATYPAFAACIISKLTDIPFSFSGHAGDIYGDSTMLAKKIEMSSFLITCAYENIRYLRSNFPAARNKRIILNYHGLDLERFRYIEKKQLNTLHILSVGRIEESKGYFDLIEAFQILKRDKIRFKATIIGDGPLMNQLTNRIEECRLGGDILLTGAIPYDEAIQWYGRATVFVLPAIKKYHRGIPNVLVESMASGLPVITTPLPAVKHELIVNDENGILIPERSPNEIVASIKYLAGNETLRKKIIRNARKTVEDKFNFTKNIDQLFSLFPLCQYK